MGDRVKGGYRLARVFKVLKQKISGLFEPEEVEVTFRHDGNRLTYTYTKVSHKQVA